MILNKLILVSLIFYCLTTYELLIPQIWWLIHIMDTISEPVKIYLIKPNKDKFTNFVIFFRKKLNKKHNICLQGSVYIHIVDEKNKNSLNIDNSIWVYMNYILTLLVQIRNTTHHNLENSTLFQVHISWTIYQKIWW